MFEKVVKYLVYVLSFLIMLVLVAIIYGIYTKITVNTSIKNKFIEDMSLSLSLDQNIKDIQVINEKTILITIIDKNEIQGIIFDLDDQQIIQRITK